MGWSDGRILYGPDSVEGNVLVGLNNEGPKVWRVCTRKKKEMERKV